MKRIIFLGHRTGPNSVQMKKKINECDKHLGYLLNEIDKNIKLKNNLHLIVTSDHGMEEINSIDQPNYLEDYVDMTKLEAFGTKTVLNIFVNSRKSILKISRTCRRDSLSEMRCFLSIKNLKIIRLFNKSSI